ATPTSPVRGSMAAIEKVWNTSESRHSAGTCANAGPAAASRTRESFMRCHPERSEGSGVSVEWPALFRDARSLAPLGMTKPQMTLVATIVASSMTFIDGTVVNVALPALQASLDATITDVQ